MPLPPPRAFAHAPYAEGVRPFSIALAPLDGTAWLAPDARLGAELSQKERILAAEGPDAFRAEPGTEAAQAEAADAVIDHLAARFADTWRRAADATVSVTAPGHARTFRPADFADRPLDLAGRIVQDDLVLMRRGPQGWRLAAASLCFPSSWSLRDKFGRDMHAIHETVPGFAGTMATRVDRIFDNLKPGAPVFRLNWSIYADDRLRHHLSKNAPVYADERAGRPAEAMFVRVERQTLLKLAGSGDILFTIRVMVDPLAALAAHPEGPRLAHGLATAIAAFDRDQLAYKGLAEARDRLVEGLARLAAV